MDISPLAIPQSDLIDAQQGQIESRPATTAAEPSLWEGMKAAADVEWVTSSVFRSVGGEKFLPDPSFQWTKENYKELAADIDDDDHRSYVLEARSEAEAQMRRAKLNDLLQSEQMLDRMGWQGAGLRMGAAVLDPVAIGAVIVTDGALAPFIAAAKVSRLARAGRAAAAGLATEGSLNVYKLHENPVYQTNDAILDTVLATTLSGGFAALTRAGHAHGVKIDMDEQASKLANTLDAEQVRLGDVKAGPVDMGSASAAAVTGGNKGFEPSVGWRIDMRGKAGQSDDPEVRELAEQLFPDVVYRGQVNKQGAWGDVDREARSSLVQVLRGHEPALNDYLSETGTGWLGKEQRRLEFNEHVSKAIRRDGGTYSADLVQRGVITQRQAAAIDASADNARKIMEDLRAKQEAAGVPGFDKVASNPKYLSRILNYGRISKMLSAFPPGVGRTELGRFLGRALQSNNPSVDPKLAEKVGIAWMEAVAERGAGNDPALMRVFAMDDVKAMAAFLRNEMGAKGFNAADIDDVVDATASAMRKKKPDAGNAPRAKMRTSFDEAYSETINGQRVSVEDFFENDFETIMQSYIRQSAGQIALAKRGLAGGEFQKRIADIRSRAMDEATKGRREKDIERLETMYKSVAGMPLRERTGWDEAWRRLRDFNFVRLMGQVGLAQIAEFAQATQHIGFGTIMRYIPAVAHSVKRAKDGSLPNQFINEIELFWGVGADRYTSKMLRHYDSITQTYTSQSTNSLLRKYDAGMEVTKRVVADVSLMAPITSFQRRMMTAAAIDKFARLADKVAKGGTLSDGFRKRMAVLGFSETDMAEIGKIMGQTVTREPGVLGRRVRSLNFDQWDAIPDGPYWRDKFMHGMQTWIDSAIQSNNIGDLPLFMTTSGGQMLTQFRSFMMVAYTKQLLAGIATRDATTAASWSLSMALAGMTYIGQQYVNSVGREDRAEYLEKRLSVGSIAANAFSRASFSTFAPMAADTVLGFFGQDQVFSFGRTTDLSGGILGNPTVDLVFGRGAQTVAKLGGYIANPDQNFTSGDLRSLMSLLVLQNTYGVKNLVNALASELPQH